MITDTNKNFFTPDEIDSIKKIASKMESELDWENEEGLAFLIVNEKEPSELIEAILQELNNKGVENIIQDKLKALNKSEQENFKSALVEILKEANPQLAEQIQAVESANAAKEIFKNKNLSEPEIEQIKQFINHTEITDEFKQKLIEENAENIRKHPQLLSVVGKYLKIEPTHDPLDDLDILLNELGQGKPQTTIKKDERNTNEAPVTLDELQSLLNELEAPIMQTAKKQESVPRFPTGTATSTSGAIHSNIPQPFSNAIAKGQETLVFQHLSNFIKGVISKLEELKTSNGKLQESMSQYITKSIESPTPPNDVASAKEFLLYFSPGGENNFSKQINFLETNFPDELVRIARLHYDQIKKLYEENKQIFHGSIAPSNTLDTKSEQPKMVKSSRDALAEADELIKELEAKEQEPKKKKSVDDIFKPKKQPPKSFERDPIIFPPKKQPKSRISQTIQPPDLHGKLKDTEKDFEKLSTQVTSRSGANKLMFHAKPSEKTQSQNLSSNSLRNTASRTDMGIKGSVQKIVDKMKEEIKAYDKENPSKEFGLKVDYASDDHQMAYVHEPSQKKPLLIIEPDNNGEATLKFSEAVTNKTAWLSIQACEPPIEINTTSPNDADLLAIYAKRAEKPLVFSEDTLNYIEAHKENFKNLSPEFKETLEWNLNNREENKENVRPDL